MTYKIEYRNGKHYASIWESETRLWADPHGWLDSSDASAEACDQMRRIHNGREELARRKTEQSLNSAAL